MLDLQNLKPMLMEERPIIPTGPEWIHELKYRGIRVMAAFGTGSAQLKTRNGANATKWFPEVTDSLAEVSGGLCITDGEMCVIDALGRCNFEGLQERARHRCWYVGAKPVVYCVFDLLVERGAEIANQPLMSRKAALQHLFPEPPWGILVAAHFEKGARRLWKEVVIPLGLEWLIAKRRSSIYQPGVRSKDWVKVKLTRGTAQAAGCRPTT